ncbi:MAG: hypothetical protein LBC99_09145 [Spirochaetota bacterium]|jgi:hypothetical protein|nr:hypothetical protein [Spirochaetota bacterium]
MEILIIVFINVLFLVIVYATLSRKIRRIESRNLPEQLENEMNSIITNFNGTAAGNIDLLDDRLRRLEPLAARAEKLSTELDGQLKRAEALGKLRELAQPRVIPEEPRIPPEQPRQSAALAYRETQQEALRVPPKAAAEGARAQEKKSAAKFAPAKKAAKKKIRKSPDEILREMTEAGDDPGEIARVLGMPREEVVFKQRLLGMKQKDTGQGRRE